MAQLLPTGLPAGGVNDFDRPDLICLSHLRWDFVYQRPQHLLSRAARDYRVFFVEEPKHVDGRAEPRLEVTRQPNGVRVVVPYVPREKLGETAPILRRLLDNLIAKYEIQNYILWYYTPAALTFSSHLNPLVVVYDCMDELSAFRGASPALVNQEAELLRRAHLVLAGGASLYEAKRKRHAHVHLFPSSIDTAHFRQARNWQGEPADQADIPHPRLGYFGVLDERLDLALINAIARVRPHWHLVFIGPRAKIEAADLPQGPNIHYLGMKSYLELPAYLAGWDVALLPFAINEATRFISPTKTPEYLAGGKPVVATPIRDVVRPYGELGMVQIAALPDEFVAATARTLATPTTPAWQRQVDEYLAQTSWDKTWAGIARLLEAELNIRHAPALARARIAQAHTGELLFGELPLNEM